MYIFGQVTEKQRRSETFDTTKIYNAAFKIVLVLSIIACFIEFYYTLCLYVTSLQCKWP